MNWLYIPCISLGRGWQEYELLWPNISNQDIILSRTDFWGGMWTWEGKDWRKLSDPQGQFWNQESLALPKLESKMTRIVVIGTWNIVIFHPVKSNEWMKLVEMKVLLLFICLLFEQYNCTGLNSVIHTLVQVCREYCCHVLTRLGLYKHECRRKPLICFEQVSSNEFIINSWSSSSFTSSLLVSIALSSSCMTIVSCSSLSSICKQ